MVTKGQRRVRRMLQVYDEPEDATAVIDALTDLRHWCDARGWDVAALDRVAHDHYLAERLGEVDSVGGERSWQISARSETS